MAIPKAVQAQADRADALLKQQQQQATNPGETPAPQAATTPGEQPASPPQHQTPPSTPPQPAADPGKQQQTDWKSKYFIMQGKYDAEVPRLSHEVSQLKNELNELRKQNQELLAQKNAQPEPPPKTEELPENIKALLKDYDELEPLVNWVLENRNQVQPSPNNGVSNDEIEELRGRVDHLQQSSHQNAEERYYQLLNDLCPDWETINQDTRFIAWLGEIETYTGQKRHVLLTDAHNKLDANRSAVFFNAWKTETGAQQQQQDKKLEGKVQPENNRGGGGNPPMKQTYTLAYVKKFYDDLRRGKYRNNPEEATRIDKEIIAAQAEGIITQQ